MGLLSRSAIRRRLAEGSLTIDPPPSLDDFGSDSVDVHLGHEFVEWKRRKGATLTVSTWDAAFNYLDHAEGESEPMHLDGSGVVTLRPHSFCLAQLRQYTKLPNDLAMHIQGKSTHARLGIMIHLTAPHAHAGWQGTLTLEIYNLGPFNFEMKPGMAIGQLTFWTIVEPEQSDLPVGQFQGQQSPTGSK